MDEMNLEQPNQKFDRSIFYLLAGGLVLLLFNLSMRFAIPENRRLFSDILAGIGFLFSLLSAFCIEQKRIPDWLPVRLKVASTFFQITPIQFIVLFFSLLLSITAAIASGFGPNLYSPLVALLSWAGAITLIVVAGWEKHQPSYRPQTREILFVISLLVISLALRAIDTAHYPSALAGDEASSGIYSLNFAQGLTNNIFNVGWYGFPSLFYFIQSLGIDALGQTIPALRIISAMIGSLTIVALYFVGKAVFSTQTAVTASILLAFSHYHIHFSRIGLNNIWDGLSWVVTLGVLWMSWQRERKAAFILAGLSLGFSQYFYTSARSLFVIVPVWLILVSLQNKKKYRRMLPNIILMTISTVVVVMPLAWFFINNPNDFQAPMNRVTILGNWLIDHAIHSGKTIPELLGEHFVSSLMGLTSKPLQLWYEPGYGVLRPISAGFFYGGFVLMMLKIKENRVWLTLLWLGLIILAGTLSTPVPAAQRYVAAIPVCCLIIGFGIDQIIKFCGKYLHKYQRILLGCVMLGVLAIAVDDARFYFFDYSLKANFGGYKTQVAQRLSNYLQDYDNSWEVVFSGGSEMTYNTISSIRFLSPHIKGTDLMEPWGSPDNVIPGNKKKLFVFLPPFESALKQCMQQYPGGELITEYNHENKLYYLYKVQNP